MRSTSWRGLGLRASPEGGFTLIELVIVGAILGLLVALILSFYLAARRRAGVEESLQRGQAWQTLQRTAYEEARRVGQEWRTPASILFVTPRCNQE